MKELYPLPRLKKQIEEQAVYRVELGGGGWLEALPGKNPDKIRSEHPTIVCMDEAAFNPNGAEAYRTHYRPGRRSCWRSVRRIPGGFLI